MAPRFMLAVQSAFIGYTIMLILDYHFHFLDIDWSPESFSLFDTDLDDE